MSKNEATNLRNADLKEKGGTLENIKTYDYL